PERTCWSPEPPPSRGDRRSMPTISGVCARPRLNPAPFRPHIRAAELTRSSRRNRVGEIRRREPGLLARSLAEGRKTLRRARAAPWLDGLALAGPPAPRVVTAPPDPWPGDPVRGADLLAGRF